MSLGIYFLLCVITKLDQQVSLLTHKTKACPLCLSLQWNQWLPGRFGVEVDLRQMFIRFRKQGKAGIIGHCCYCSLMTHTRLFFINKSDDVLSRLLRVEEHAFLHTKGRETRLLFGSDTMKYCRLKLWKSSVLMCFSTTLTFAQISKTQTWKKKYNLFCTEVVSLRDIVTNCFDGKHWIKMTLLQCELCHRHITRNICFVEIHRDTHLISSVSGTLVYGSMALTLLLSSTGCGQN